jgi:hypothetical protein
MLRSPQGIGGLVFWQPDLILTDQLAYVFDSSISKFKGYKKSNIFD